MMILEILKWIGMAILVLFGFGCVLAFLAVIAIVLAADEQKQGELPFHCMISDERCPTPDTPCNECEIYQIGEPKHDNQDNGNT